MKIFKYIGESNRSAYERGFEHLQALGNMEKGSHMLRHILEKHENQDFSEVKWHMNILEYTRSAFERQIKEAVKIQQDRGGQNILNSKSEWNQCALPRLVTRIGNQEMKSWEEEIAKERKLEELIEEKVRIFRKGKVTARLERNRDL